MVWKLGITATSHGTIMVERKRKKSAERNGKRMNENAYAASADVATWPTVMIAATIRLFSR